MTAQTRSEHEALGRIQWVELEIEELGSNLDPSRRTAYGVARA